MVSLPLWSLLPLALFPQDTPDRPDPEFAPTVKIESKIEWYDGGLDEAFELARKTQRLVLLHFWAHW
jgi:hypothetical protein